jgi:Uma2 family endonuclease
MVGQIRKEPADITVTLLQQNTILVAPTLAIEIVSARRGLNPALKKMELFWMKAGTDIGLVFCLFSKKVYIFEQGQPKYRSQDIYQIFTYPKLPNYKNDF